MRTFRLAFFLLAVAAAQVWGQAKGGTTAPTGPTTLSTGGTSNGSTTVGGFPRDNRILMLQGKVVLDDGNLPRDPITIERVCGTYVYKEGFANIWETFCNGTF